MIWASRVRLTPSMPKVVAAAAKLCYSDAHITDLLDGLDEEKTAKFLTLLSDLGHASPIEHASFTFGIEGVSRTLLAQITRQQALPSAPCRGRTPCAPRCRPVHSALRRKPPILRQNLL